ncbi:MAG: hypothetical protein MJ080_03820 [Clostridia bacterium]|nr:hypothetical protein [Clostridia bacterium]
MFKRDEKRRKDIELHNVTFDDFIKVLDHCKGDVYLETADGNTLNLKSKLCQLLGLSALLSKTETIDTTIRCTDPEDEVLLLRLNVYGEVPGEEK